MSNISGGIQFVENGHGFLAVNKNIISLLTDLNYSPTVKTDDVMSFENLFYADAVPTMFSATLDGSFICTSGNSFSSYSGYTGSTLIASGTLTGSTNGFKLLATHQSRQKVNVTAKLAASEVIRATCIIESVSVKAKAGNMITGDIKLLVCGQPTISAT